MSANKATRKKSIRLKRRSGSPQAPDRKRRRAAGTTKGDAARPDVLEMVEEGLNALGKIKDVKTTLKEFDRLMYPAPREYSASDIVRLRERTLRMSQAAFALACNAKLSTLQKWESGVNKPTPPVNRLFQIIERGGLAFLAGKG